MRRLPACCQCHDCGHWAVIGKPSADLSPGDPDLILSLFSPAARLNLLGCHPALRRARFQKVGDGGLEPGHRPLAGAFGQAGAGNRAGVLGFAAWWTEKAKATQLIVQELQEMDRKQRADGQFRPAGRRAQDDGRQS
jgi:hypothetical protein